MNVLYNPSCSKCRALKSALDERGYAPTYRHYLDEPLSRDEALSVIRKLGGNPQRALRSKESAYQTLGLDGATPEQAADAIVAHPELINRPIVTLADSAIVARPPEDVFKLIPDRMHTHRVARMHELDAVLKATLIRDTDRTYDEFRSAWAGAPLKVGTFIDNDDSAIASALFFEEPFEDTPALRLRGMATAQHAQQLGIGSALLDFAIGQIRDTFPSVDLLWCNARVSALKFYDTKGWTPVGDEFEIDGVGPHVRMTRSLRRTH